MRRKQANKLVGELIIQTKMPKQRRTAAAKKTYQDVSDKETTAGTIAEDMIERTVASLSARTVRCSSPHGINTFTCACK